MPRGGLLTGEWNSDKLAHKIKEKLNLPEVFKGPVMNQSLDFTLFKTLAHPERYAILQRLMAGRATLTQLGESFNKTPAHIRHHLKALEEAGLVEFVEARPVQGGPEKYYQATRRALIIHQTILPEVPQEKTGISISSMDPGLRKLGGIFARARAPIALLPVPLSSLDGLIALRQGLCQMSTCHLIDLPSGEYNRPFIQRLFPSQPMALIQMYRREEGLMVKAGNPLGIRSLEDLARPDVVLVNREAGSGVRQWLDLNLARLGIQPAAVRGYASVVHSHASVARAVQTGSADVGVGIAASARTFGLDFIPLFEEPYEIVLARTLLDDQRYTAFFEGLNSAEFRAAIRSTEGYVVPQNAGGIEIVC